MEATSSPGSAASGGKAGREGRRRWLRVLPRAAILLCILAATVLVAGKVRSATAEENGFTQVADKVLVNRAGGILVSGTCNCTDAVVAYYGSEDLIPDDLVVLVGVEWDAYQYVGRTKVIHAQYRSAIAHPCYVNPDAVPPPGGEWPSGPDYAWTTAYPYPVGGTQWVYSPDGKFGAGQIQVDVRYMADPDPENPTFGDVYLYSWSHADLKAVKVR